MALLTSEISRIKAELGYNVLAVGAEPYIGIVALFEQVIQPYTLAGASTTSATQVEASTTPTPVGLQVASATGFSVGDVIIVDVDARQERATVSRVNSNIVTVQLTKEHSGTYPVFVEGGESIIRDILRKLIELSSGMNGNRSTLAAMSSRLGIKRVDDVEFFGGGGTLASQGIDPLTQVFKLREMWRDELASVLGIPRLNGQFSSGGSTISVY